MRSLHTLQEVLQFSSLKTYSSFYTESVLTKLSNCRTAKIGYHHYQCDNPECNQVHYQYHACRNRHCPQCNWQKQEEWMEARIIELLPVKYFHVVFTLPHELNALVMGNRVKLFKQLFDSASNCLLSLSLDHKWLGATPSITAVLHTWGQQLSFHPHLHCIVSGGGVNKALNWVNLKKKTENGYLFPYQVMEPLFKKHFLSNLNRMIINDQIAFENKSLWPNLKNKLFEKKWIVYAKSPMGNGAQVVEYLARYAHKVAISNHRIIEHTNKSVRFQYKDYNDHNKSKIMELPTDEFIRRFEQHILPRGFVKMRHYGILGNSKRKSRIRLILIKMKLPPHPPAVKIPFHLRMLEKYGVDVKICQVCNKGRLELRGIFTRIRGSPLCPSNSEKI